MPLRREVIYPIFLKCIDYTGNDTFWRETFEELSYGNCYQGSYINKGFLCSNIKGKEFIYLIEFIKMLSNYSKKNLIL